MTLDLGILLALSCAFVANLDFFYKYRGANEVPKVQVMHPFRSARALYSSKWFTLGMLTAVASWGLHVGALALAPMSVVQVSLAAGVVLIAVMAERMFGFQVGRRQWVGLVLTAGGLVLLGVTLPAMHGAHSQFSSPAMISFEAGLFGLGGLLIMGPRMGGPTEHHGVMLGAASGILFGVSDTEPLAGGGSCGVGRGLLCVRARAAGRGGGAGDRCDRHGGEHRGDRRRDRRVRRPHGGERLRGGAPGDRFRPGDRGGGADAGAGARGGHGRSGPGGLAACA